MVRQMSESAFYMWRALFAISHADDVVSREERSFMNTALEQQPFSPAQREILQYDMEEKQNIRALFDKITDQQDRSRFFEHARKLVWSDGDFGGSEQEIMMELSQRHFAMADLESFEVHQDLKLDQAETGPVAVADRYARAEKNSFLKKIMRTMAGL